MGMNIRRKNHGEYPASRKRLRKVAIKLKLFTTMIKLNMGE